jgi:hypothetical protein
MAICKNRWNSPSPLPSAAFSDIRAYRRASSTDLSHNAKNLMLWKIRRYVVAIEGQLMGFYPNLQVTKIFHCVSFSAFIRSGWAGPALAAL